MTTTLGIKVDEDIRFRLKALGEARQRSTHWIMKDAILRYLEHKEEIERRNIQADQAWKDYKETGQYVNHEDMMVWLGTWGTDREAECPNIKN
jgi:predicted transcriptional regulator